MYYIGVDLGTSAVKLLLMEGTVKSAISFQMNIHYLSLSRDGLSRNRKTGGMLS